ncbi:branched-chain amino acid ABC transporter permease [Bradyrhizobium sp. Pear77]|uniref:branched-chain amino acid ABC transporter permease n=1 Tax=Bradyrhizobium altum TaxID=1571202 RepID=UPI00289BBD16|nr:branched-chain amino acid ABC transporter permease [Bradyrhizobium altum]MCC8953537.1 branched-chain amino acid ABC transporter permease [Bradyrhizobium altum]
MTHFLTTSYSVFVGRLLLACGIVFLATGPFLLDASGMQVMTEFMLMLVLALMWNLLAGYADIVTIGQHAFVGVGAYAFFGFLVFGEWNPYLSVLMAGAVAMLLAVPVMVIIFRLRTAYLAVGSWVVAETLMLCAGKLSAFGGGSGISMPVSAVKQFGARIGERYAHIYWLALVLLAVVFISTWLLMRSAVGLGLTAMRDNEDGAGAVGVNLTRSRVLCFLWTAPFLGLAGALITLQKLRVAPPASFSITEWTVYIIFIVLIGGVGSFEGPVIGGIVFFLLREYLAEVGVWHFIVLGPISIVIILIEPRGLWGLLRRFVPGDLIPVSYTPSALKGTKTEKARSLAASTSDVLSQS